MCHTKTSLKSLMERNLFIELFVTLLLRAIRAAVTKVSSQVIPFRVNLVAELDRTRRLVIVIIVGFWKTRLFKEDAGHLGGAPEKSIWIVFRCAAVVDLILEDQAHILESSPDFEILLRSDLKICFTLYLKGKTQETPNFALPSLLLKSNQNQMTRKQIKILFKCTAGQVFKF